MERQITQCHFLITTNNGTSESEVYNSNVNIYSGYYDYVPYYFTSSPYDESIRGTLRSQLGGYRFEAMLQWERLINATPFFSVINNVTEISSNITRIYFSPDATNTATNIDVIISPTEMSTKIDGTIARQPLSMQITGRTVEQEVPSWFIL